MIKINEQEGGGFIMSDVTVTVRVEDTELFDTKEFRSYEREVGPVVAKEFVAKTDQELKDSIASCTVSINQAKAELDVTPEYEKAKAVLKDFNESFNHLAIPKKKAIKLASFILNKRKRDQQK